MVWYVAEWEGCGRVLIERWEGGVCGCERVVVRLVGRSMVAMIEANL